MISVYEKKDHSTFLSLSGIIKKDRNIICLIFLVAFTLRVIYLGLLANNPFFGMPSMDPQIHNDWAYDIANKDFFYNTPFFRAPLYPYFLSLFYIFSEKTITNYVTILLVQFLMGSLSCVLLYLIGRRVYNVKVGILSGLVASFYWIFIYFEGELLIPVLLNFLNLLGFLILIEALHKRTLPYFFLSGLCFGLSAITRPNILLFFPFLIIWLFLMLKKSPEPQKAVKTCAVLILAIVSCIMPVTLINYVAGDDLILISSQGGVNFYIGNNEKSDGVSAVVPGTRSTWQGGYNDTINIAENEAGRKLKPSEVSRFWFKKGLAFILNQPKAALALYFKKLLFFLNYYEVSNNQDIYFFINFYGFLNLPVFISFWMVAPFAYVGILVNRKEPYWWLFTGFLIAQLFSFLLFFVCARFRVSFIPFLILFASAFIINKIDKIKRKKSYGFGMDGVISIMIFAFFLYSVCVQRPVYYNNMDNLSPGIYYLASRYFSKGNLEQSEKYFLKLTDYHEPYSSLSLMLLGFINFHKKNDDKALNYFSEAIKRDQNTWKDIENFLLDGKNRGKMILNKIKNAQ